MKKKTTRAVVGAVGLILAAAVTGCGPAAAQAPTIRLVDAFAEARIEGSPPAAPTVEPVEWRWDGELRAQAGDTGAEEGDTGAEEADAGTEAGTEAAGAVGVDAGPTLGWTAIHGIEGLTVREGTLAGSTTDDAVLLAVPVPEDLLPDDVLHALEIRMRATAGSWLGAGFSSEEEPEWEGWIEDAEDSSNAPLVTSLTADGEMHTYTLTAADSSFEPSFHLGDVRHLVLFPTEVADAEFAIESVRVVSRKEHLTSIGSGPGWHGLDEIYREAIVARSPERLSFDLRLPQGAWLDLDVGTVEHGPVTFRVAVGDRSENEPAPLMRRTVTTPERWESVRIDLREHAGREATLVLEIEAEELGRIGFWGTVTVRSAGAGPAVAGRGVSRSRAREALAAERPEPPQGVIVILADTLRRDHLQFHGYGRETAPLLGRMLEQGTVFADAIAQGAWTKVSVPSILTSLYATTHGIVDMPDRLPASATTLSEAYRDAGYATFHTSSVPFSGKLTNLHQGVDVLHERASIGELGHSTSKTARTFVDRLLPWLETHRDVPFFVFLHVFDPHSPFEPYRPYDTTWAEPADRDRHLELVEATKEHADNADEILFFPPKRSEIEAAGVDPAEYVATEIDWYDGSILAMDAEIGRLLERLGELGLADRTLIAFVSDHGEEFLEHDRHFHGHDVYGDMVNVPLALWWPGVVPGGLVAERTVQTIDLMPTLLELSDLQVPDQAQGQSLLPLLADPQRPARLGWEPRPAFSERATAPSEKDPDPDLRDSFAIVADGWKLVHNVERPDGWPEYELYDHVADPINLADVAADHPDVVERLAAELHTWRERAEAARLSHDDATRGLSPEEIERLRSLGYIQ